MSNKKLYLWFCIGGISILIRILGKFLLDDTVLYNVVIVGYTQAFIAFSMFYIFVYLGSEIKANKFVKYIDYISFEVYLVHYVYMVGPLRFMGLTKSFILNTITTITVSCITAIILNKICSSIYNLLDSNKVNNEQKTN